MRSKVVISIFIVVIMLISGYAYIGNHSFTNGKDAASEFPAVSSSSTTNFTLTFNENGLKLGMLWAITIYSSGSSKSYSAMPEGYGYPNRNISINLSQGQYNFRIGMLINQCPGAPLQLVDLTEGYYISPASGTVNLNNNKTIEVDFITANYFDTMKLGGVDRSSVISENSSLTSNLYVAGNLTIEKNVVLYTNGYSVIVSGTLINHGSIIAGWPFNQGNETNPNAQNYPYSYGGSGGGADSHDFSYAGGNGGSTLVAGGSNAIDGDAQSGSSPTMANVNASNIKAWFNNNITNYLTGAGGGFSYGWGALNGGSGSYGIYLQANRIIAGNISAAGLQSANVSNLANGGAGGGGVILIAYGNGGIVGRNYTYNGGLGITNTASYSGGGSGGNGNVVFYHYNNVPPITISNTTGLTSNINIKAYNTFNNTFSQIFSIIMSNQSMNRTVTYNATNGNAIVTGVPYGDWSLVGVETAYGVRVTNISMIQVSSSSLNLTLNMTAPAPKSLSLALTSQTSNVIYGPSDVVIYASVNGYVGNYSNITYYINKMPLITYLENTEGHLIVIPLTKDGTYSVYANVSSGGYYFGKYYKDETTESNILTFTIEPDVYEATMTDGVPSNITFSYNSLSAALIDFNNGNAYITTKLKDNADVFSFPQWAQQIFGLINPVYQLAYGSQGNLELHLVYNGGTINLTNFDIGIYTPSSLNNSELTFYLMPSTFLDGVIDLGLMALSAFASLHIGNIIGIILPMVISTVIPVISSFITSSSSLASLVTHIPGILMSLVHVIPTMWPQVLNELSKEFTGDIANELTTAADTIKNTFAGIFSDIFVFEKVGVLVADAVSLIYSIINGPIKQNVVVSNLHPDTVATIKGDAPYSNVSYKNYYASYNGVFSSNNGYISHSKVINDTYAYLIPTNEFNVSISAPRNVSSEDFTLNVQYLNDASSQNDVATASPTSFSVHANGTAITFTPIGKSHPQSGISNTVLYFIIGIVAAVAVIGSVLAIMRKRR